MTIDTKQLECLLERVTPGEWEVTNYDCGGGKPWNGFPCIDSPDEDCGIVHWDGFVQDYWRSANGHEGQIHANAELMAMSKALARRVIAAEKLVNAIRDYWLKPDVQNSAEIEAIISEWDKSQ